MLTALAELFATGPRPLTMMGAGNRDEAYAIIAAHPDLALVLLDLTLPGTRGLEFLARLRAEYPRLPVAILSATHDRATIEAAMAAGARGFIAKTTSAKDLQHAVLRVLDGRSCPPPRIARSAPARLPEFDLGPDLFGLTQRQSDVLRLLVQGKPNKLICRDLNLSEGTVKVHVSAILRALNVHTRAQAIVALSRRGVAVLGSGESH